MLSDRNTREKIGIIMYSQTIMFDKVIGRQETLYRDLHAANESTKAKSGIYGDSLQGSQV